MYVQRKDGVMVYIPRGFAPVVIPARKGDMETPKQFSIPLGGQLLVYIVRYIQKADRPS